MITHAGSFPASPTMLATASVIATAREEQLGGIARQRMENRKSADMEDARRAGYGRHEENAIGGIGSLVRSALASARSVRASLAPCTAREDVRCACECDRATPPAGLCSSLCLRAWRPCLDSGTQPCVGAEVLARAMCERTKCCVPNRHLYAHPSYTHTPLHSRHGRPWLISACAPAPRRLSRCLPACSLRARTGARGAHRASAATDLGGPHGVRKGRARERSERGG
jgi:hypothetical protein